jgi:hypothetical protein
MMYCEGQRAAISHDESLPERRSLSPLLSGDLVLDGDDTPVEDLAMDQAQTL